jgi:hypothetical protein
MALGRSGVMFNRQKPGGDKKSLFLTVKNRLAAAETDFLSTICPFLAKT